MSYDNVTTAEQVPATRWPELVGEHAPRGPVEAHAAIKAYEHTWVDVHATLATVMAQGKDAAAAMAARAEHIAAVTRTAAALENASNAVNAEGAFKATPDTPYVPGFEAKPKKQHSWWRVSMMLYSGTTVIRNVSGKRPTVTSIKKAGWHEVRDDGDEYYVASEAIMTVEINGGFAENHLATPWHQVNGGK